MSERPTAPVALALLAEPDVIARHALAEFLRKCGLHVVEAASSDEAVAVFSDSTLAIDVLLCDAKLGGSLGGFGLARWVREHRPTVDIELTGSLEATAGKAQQICEQVSDPEMSKLRPRDNPQSVVDRILQLRARRERNA